MCGKLMKYELSQGYRFYMGDVVLMYFIQSIPYTFDELPTLVQDHPEVQAEALNHKDWDDNELYMLSSYLVEEQCHPLMYDVELLNPELLPKDD